MLIRRLIPLSRASLITANSAWKQKSLALIQERGFGGEPARILPPLPVPELEKTIGKFLSLVKPIQSVEDYERTVKLAESFRQSVEASNLQKLLEERARRLGNWLTPWWLEIAYLSARTPLPVVTSPGVIFPCFKFTGLDGQVEYAAKIIQAALKFHQKILRDELELDRAHGQPLDMSQYKLLFGTTRIAKHGKDEIRYGKDQPKWADNILVTRDGNTFKMRVIDESGQMLGLDELQSQLRCICDQNLQPNRDDAINIISSDDRESWATVYGRLREKNPTEVEAVENALFVICLDRHFDGLGGLPEDRNMATALHGGGTAHNSNNRWFDKTLQFYVNENGYGGMTYEHTPAEGPPLARLLDYICDEIEKNQFESSPKTSSSKPQLLNFNLDSADRKAIQKASEKLNRVVQNLEVRSLAFDKFGKNVPKKAQLSPDSWIQLALQLAYFRIHRRPAPAYETGTLRKFREGRTDTIRLPSMASKHFVEAISKVPRPPTVTANALMTLLESAVASHKQYSLEVMNGHGIDRHLLGLKLIAQENGLPIPQLFQSEAYKQLTHFLLSTSQVPTRQVLPMGFGPSEPDCYGICYNPQESRIFFTITAFNECPETSAERFAKELSTALVDMCDVVDMAGRVKERAKL